MTNIIRKQEDIAAASIEVLVASYNALTGETVARFSSRAVAERRVAMAILSAEDSAAHAGVPKGQPVVAKTVDELRCVCGCMATELNKTAELRDKPVPRASKKLNTLRVTNAGTSKVQPASARAAVLLFVAESPDGTATLAQITAAFELPVRGHLQKLMAANHLEAI